MSSDWIPVITALAGLIGGLGGAWIIGSRHIDAQRIAQREENKRALRRLAYEAAISEWRTTMSANKIPDEMIAAGFGIEHFIHMHLALAGSLLETSPETHEGRMEILKILEGMNASFLRRMADARLAREKSSNPNANLTKYGVNYRANTLVACQVCGNVQQPKSASNGEGNEEKTKRPAD